MVDEETPLGHRVATGLAAVVLLAGCAADDVVGGDAAGDVEVEDGDEVVVDGAAVADVDRALAYDPPRSYEVDLEVTCFCPANLFTVTVRDGEVVDRTAVDESGDALDLPAPPAYATSIEDIQRQLRESARGEGVVTALELGGGGLPLVVGLDPAPDVVDDEVTFRVLDVRPVG